MAPSLTFERFHGGAPKQISTLSAAYGSSTPVEELSACSYLAVKNNSPDIYRHVFEKFEGRGPYLLRLDKRGTYYLQQAVSRTFAIGRLVDLETAQGVRIVVGGAAFLIADRRGDHVWIAGKDIPFGLEQRKEGPKVTERGIEE